MSFITITATAATKTSTLYLVNIQNECILNKYQHKFVFISRDN